MIKIIGKADLHIHSCLSPCADLDMGPVSIIEKCLEQEITHFSITDIIVVETCQPLRN